MGAVNKVLVLSEMKISEILFADLTLVGVSFNVVDGCLPFEIVSHIWHQHEIISSFKLFF